MSLETISRDEFDRRLEQSTGSMRERRLLMEAHAGQLEDLLGRYSSVLERLEAENEQTARRPEQERDDLRRLLNDLAVRTAAVAASL